MKLKLLTINELVKKLVTIKYLILNELTTLILSSTACQHVLNEEHNIPS